MAILGIDFGLKKVGLAISQGEIASPTGIVSYTDINCLCQTIADYCQKQNVETIVIGMPEMSESAKPVRAQIEVFSAWIKVTLKLPLFFEPEVFTTQAAKQKLLEAYKKRSRRQKDDDFAAALILQSFLERKA